MRVVPNDGLRMGSPGPAGRPTSIPKPRFPNHSSQFPIPNAPIPTPNRQVTTAQQPKFAPSQFIWFMGIDAKSAPPLPLPG